jgi:exonuclease SbcC
MDLRLKKMTLLNFKGCKQREIDFNTIYSVISGPNESGKSTVMDAFTWCMFGKDSKDRTDFNIKTLDAKGNVIERIPHEVTCLFEAKDVNMVTPMQVELKRCYVEKWTKKRGSDTEEFTGHEVERYYNGVPCSEKEFKQKIEELIPEAIFKLITNPLYFPSLKKDQQRTILLSMVGNVSNEEIAKGNKDFLALLDMLFGKTLEEFKREIGAKKKRVKDDLAGIPERIDERKRSMPQAENWAEIESEISVKTAEINDIDEQLTDITKRYEAQRADKEKIQSKIFSLKNERASLINKIESEFMQDYYNKKSEHQKTLQNRFELKEQLQRAELNTTRAKMELDTLQVKRTKLIDEWKSINAEKLTFNENEFTCPTCDANFEPHKIEEKQAEMTAKFNQSKAERLAENQKQGLETKSLIEKWTNGIANYEQEVKAINDTLESIKPTAEPTEPDKSKIDFSSDLMIIGLENDILALEKELSTEIVIPQNEELQEKRAIATQQRFDLQIKFNNKNVIAESEARIAELEKQLKTLNKELADLEKIEFTIASFSKEKITRVENEINSLFTNVNFRMFETQINGGEVETCEALVKGVPFSDANTAGKINAGLDIINAISKHHNAFAPIFIDNSEACNNIIKTNSQQITMQVTGAKTEFSVN